MGRKTENVRKYGVNAAKADWLNHLIAGEMKMWQKHDCNLHCHHFGIYSAAISGKLLAPRL